MERITKIGMAQLLINRLFPNPTNDKKLREPEAMLLISHARDQVCAREINSNRLEEKNIDGSWLSTFKDLKVTKTGDCESEVILPARPVKVFSEQGIYNVWTSNDRRNVIYPSRAGHEWLYQDESFIGTVYSLEGDRLILNECIESTVNIQMLAMAEDIEPQEYFPIDGSFQGEIIDIAVQRYLTTKQIPTDNLNNNISE